MRARVCVYPSLYARQAAGGVKATRTSGRPGGGGGGGGSGGGRASTKLPAGDGEGNFGNDLSAQTPPPPPPRRILYESDRKRA